MAARSFLLDVTPVPPPDLISLLWFPFAPYGFLVPCDWVQLTHVFQHRSAPTSPLTAEPPGTSTHVSAAVPEEPEKASGTTSGDNAGSPKIGLFLNGLTQKLHVEGGNGSLALAVHGLHESARETFWNISCDFDVPRFKAQQYSEELQRRANEIQRKEREVIKQPEALENVLGFDSGLVGPLQVPEGYTVKYTKTGHPYLKIIISEEPIEEDQIKPPGVCQVQHLGHIMELVYSCTAFVICIIRMTWISFENHALLKWYLFKLMSLASVYLCRWLAATQF
ncbi:hypothetical protein Pelo_16674 [Pelomyxa schiedti]|nr:hypothetical protein Pelo_16674 [Pelomyxa schiedti]